MPYSLSREFGFVIWGLSLGGGVRDREAANAVLLALRASGSASEGARPSPAGAAGGTHSRLSRSVVSEVSKGSYGTISWD